MQLARRSQSGDRDGGSGSTRILGEAVGVTSPVLKGAEAEAAIAKVERKGKAIGEVANTGRGKKHLKPNMSAEGP